MKKVIFWVLAIILVTLCSLAVLCFQSPKTLPDGTIEIDFMKDRPNWLASRILYNHVLKELDKTPKEAKEFANIEPKYVAAYFVDLNNDGKKEIIGYVGSTFYMGSAGYSLFILQKKAKRYEDIAGFINFEPLKNLYVTNKIFNGYKVIVYYGSVAFKFSKLAVYYNGQLYFSRDTLNLFEEYLRDFADYDVSEITGIKE